MSHFTNEWKPLSPTEAIYIGSITDPTPVRSYGSVTVYKVIGQAIYYHIMQIAEGRLFMCSELPF